MKFTASLAAPSLDLAMYRKALDAHMKAVVAQGLMEWLDAVLAEIPVWSGASRATFIPLASRISYGVPISPKVISRIGTGIASSAGPLEIDEEKGRYAFEYRTWLPWLVWNEYHNANVDPDPGLFDRLLKPGPYNFQVKGYEAFQRFSRTVDLPAVGRYVTSVRVKV
jgi:hypothetical protein